MNPSPSSCRRETDQTAVVSGIVHAPGLPPASMENFSFGFVSMEFLQRLGYQGTFEELRIVSYKDRFDLQAMKTMAADIRALLAKSGYEVVRTDVPKPGKHPHADQLSSLLFLLQAFAFISLLGACLIIINLMNFIISRQSGQIAIMKTVGGRTGEIALPYFFYIFLLSMGAIILSFPHFDADEQWIYLLCGEHLNFDIASYRVPNWVPVAQVVVGLVVPLLSAAQPIYKYCSMKIKDGLNEQIAPINPKKEFLKNPWFRNNVGITLPISNLMRKKVRTGLAILALVAGGVLFMTSQNIIASIDNTVQENLSTIKWDFETRLSGANRQQIHRGRGQSGCRPGKCGSMGRRQRLFQDRCGIHLGKLPVENCPERTKMADLAGINAAPNAIVVNQVVAEEELWLHVNQKAVLQVGDVQMTVLVGGIITELPRFPPST